MKPPPKTFSLWNLRSLAVGLGLSWITSGHAQFIRTNYFFPVADASLRQAAADANDGSSNAVTVGISAGLSQNRGLFRFDLSSLPTNASVTNITLSFVTLSSVQSSTFYTLHRLLTNWVEAEVTWNDRAAATPWSTPGGLAGTDFVIPGPTILFTAAPGKTNSFSETLNPYFGLAFDVQTWVNHPAQNLGWLLMAGDTNTSNSTIQLASRENAGNQPLLAVGYTVSFTLPTLKALPPTNGYFSFSFNVEPFHGYVLQRGPEATGTNWTNFLVLDPPPMPTTAIFTDPIPMTAPRLFYRVRAN